MKNYNYINVETVRPTQNMTRLMISASSDIHILRKLSFMVLSNTDGNLVSVTISMAHRHSHVHSVEPRVRLHGWVSSTLCSVIRSHIHYITVNQTFEKKLNTGMHWSEMNNSK